MDGNISCNPVEITIKGGACSTLVLHIISLSEKPIHGYLILKMIGDSGPNGFKLHSGTLYPILHDLVDQGLIDFIDERSRRGPSRKCYFVTDKGNEALVGFDTSVSQILYTFETLRMAKPSCDPQGRE
jgi:PadR family transcriptional regulator PadR